MSNDANLKRYGHEKEVLSRDEAVRNGSKGGRNSVKSRREKANFRKTLDWLLTSEVDLPHITPVLEALGLESTYQNAMNLAMIKKAIKGDVKAYEAVGRFAGQSEKTAADEREQKARTDKIRAETAQSVAGENASNDWVASVLAKDMEDGKEDNDKTGAV